MSVRDELICPKCGRSSYGIEFIDAFCKDCYPVRLETPPKVGLEECTRCGRVRLRGVWVQPSKRGITELILARCKGQYDDADYDPESGTASFVMRGSGAKIERIIVLERIKTICQQCSRISGGYYQAIVQLRGTPLKVRGYAMRLEKKLATKTFIAKEEDTEGGLDIFVGSSKAVLAAVTDMKVRTRITKKLVGADQGKRLYRTTFLIRL
ncbi:MAG: NMD3-related protein [Candidatus Micrarchaeota archaeon]